MQNVVVVNLVVVSQSKRTCRRS